MKRAALILALALAAAPVPAAGQGAAPALDRVEALLDAHRYAEARGMLRGWWEGEGASAGSEARARGLFLRAALASDPQAAETDLLRIVVEHPNSPYADRALFRAAQSRFAHRDDAAARGHLERLVRDYPASGHHADALSLLGRSPAPGRAAAAATAPGSAAATTPRASPGARPAPPAAAAAPEALIPPPGAEFAAQIGRFPSAREAEPLRARLRAAGFDAYLARVGGSSETVVRVGSFRDQGAADAMVRRLRGAGHDARVVAIGTD